MPNTNQNLNNKDQNVFERTLTVGKDSSENIESTQDVTKKDAPAVSKTQPIVTSTTTTTITSENIGESGASATVDTSEKKSQKRTSKNNPREKVDDPEHQGKKIARDTIRKRKWQRQPVADPDDQDKLTTKGKLANKKRNQRVDDSKHPGEIISQHTAYNREWLERLVPNPDNKTQMITNRELDNRKRKIRELKKHLDELNKEKAQNNVENNPPAETTALPIHTTSTIQSTTEPVAATVATVVGVEDFMPKENNADGTFSQTENPMASYLRLSMFSNSKPELIPSVIPTITVHSREEEQVNKKIA